MASSYRLRRGLIALGVFWSLVVSPITLAAEPKSNIESLFTQETVGFLHIRVSEAWESPGMAFYRKALSSLGTDEIKVLDGKFAPNISQIESVTVIIPSLRFETQFPDGYPSGESWLWVVACKKPIDRVELAKSVGEGASKKHRGVEYYFEEAHWAGIILLNPTTIVIGSEDSILRLIEKRESALVVESPLANIFTREANKHTALFAVNPSSFETQKVLGILPLPVAPVLKASGAWASLDLKQQSQLNLTLEFPGAQQATEGAKSLEAVRKIAQELIATELEGMQKAEKLASKRPVMTVLELPAFGSPIVAKAGLKYLYETLKGLAFEMKGTSVTTSLNLDEFFPASTHALAIMVFAAVSDFDRKSVYWTSQPYSKGGIDDDVPYYIRDKFVRIGAALEAYHQDKGAYPPAALYSKDGKPLLSWRVLILPYLEQQPGELRGPGGMKGFKKTGPDAKVEQPKKTFADLYQKFKLNEPWDGLNNKKLLEQMPRVYEFSFSVNVGSIGMRGAWKTGVQAFTGPGALFPGKEAVNKGQVKDGLENSIAVIFRDDCLEAVPWTKPSDIPFDVDKQLPKLIRSYKDIVVDASANSPQPSAIYVLMADGKPRRLPADLGEKLFKGLITIAGGESVKLPEPKAPKDPSPYKEKGIPKFKD